jgi:hypothetical protein
MEYTVTAVNHDIRVHGYTMYIHRNGYTWYIHGPCISTQYIHGISMDIYCISFDVYTWYIRGISESMDIQVPGYS